MKDIRRYIKDKRTIKYMIISFVITIGIGAGTLLAWYYIQKQLVTSTKIIAPYTLRIGAGTNEDIAELYLGGIDVTKGNHKDYVFCVYSKPAGHYMLQLAHTTNIGFEFEVYRASAPSDTKPSGEEAQYAEYTDKKDRTCYFTPNANATMDKNKYINKAESNSGSEGAVTGKIIANETLRTSSYESGDNVQTDANPLYMQSDVINYTSNELQDDAILHYYILRVKWNNTISNNKETDIIYLTAANKNQ